MGSFREISPRCSEWRYLGLQARPRDCLLTWQRRGFTAVPCSFQVGCRRPLVSVVQLERLMTVRVLAVLLVHALMRWRIAFVLLAGSYRCTHLENRSPLVCPWWASRRPRGSRISAEQIIADRRTSSLMDDSSAYANNNRRTQNPRTGRCAEKPAQQRSTQTIPDSRQI